jgi:Tfp pilus assembly protein PilW
MTPRARNSWRQQAGIGVIELMIALTLTSLLLAVLYRTFFRTQHAANAVMSQVEGRQGIRAALQLIERDMRMAGSGWGRMDVEGVNNNTAFTRRGVNPGYGGSSNPDSFSVLGGWDVNTTLRASMVNQTSVINCQSTAGFSVGDLVVVSNGSGSGSAHLFQVTNVQSSPADLTVGNTSPYNVGTRQAWPAGGYPAGMRVFKAGWVTYRVDSTTFGRPSLVRHEFGRTPTMVAYDVSTFRVWYRMADGTQIRNALNLPMIEQVVPVLRASNSTGGPASDSIYAAIRPRTF